MATERDKGELEKLDELKEQYMIAISIYRDHIKEDIFLEEDAEPELVPRRLMLRCEGLSDLCKGKGWYTKGTAAEYATLLRIEEKEE